MRFRAALPPATLGEQGRKWLLAVAVSLLALGAYAVSLAPSITWQHDAADSGELAAAAYTFGVPHPTGYPLWLLLAAPLAHLPIGGDIAYRLGWLSAVCAALASGLMGVLTMRLLSAPAHPAGEPAADAARCDPLPATIGGVTAGLALGTSPGVWNVAVVTETYALHLLLIVALVGVALLGASRRVRSLLGGLALANHVTAVPAVVAALAARGYQRRDGAGALLWLLPGLSLYVVLPWRAVGHPPSNWGDPESPGALLALVGGTAYRYLLVVPSPLAGAERLLAAAHALVTQFALPFWLPALAGLPAFVREPALRPWLAAGGIYLAIPVFYRAAGVEHYLLPDLTLLALAAGLGAAHMASAVRRGYLAPPTQLGSAHPHAALRPASPSPRTVSPALPWLALALLAVPALLAGYQTSSLRGDDHARQWAALALASAAPHATLLTSDDDHTFALWYLQRVDHLRPDVTVVDQRLWSQPWYRRALAEGS